jgi:multiple sugar transport system permease protein
VKSALGIRESRAGWLFTAPALALIGVFFFLPVIGGLLLSFTDYDVYAIGDPAAARWVGLANYSQILTTPLFWKALGNTLFLVFAGGPLSLLASLAAALAVSGRRVRAPGLFRSIFFIPVVTTLVAVAIVWRYLYHPHYGLVNWVLSALHLPAVDWLGNPHWAMPAIILMTVWKNFGYNMLIFIAGLHTIPEDLYEAARLDGANAWDRFVHVTLPGLAPTFLFVGVTTMLGQFQVFAEPYVMTQGGPLKATTTLVMMMYEEGFRWWRLGLAAAIAFLLFILMLAGTLVQMRLQRERRP